jgi:DNA repair exonuclease SbcCD ATPase subunit
MKFHELSIQNFLTIKSATLNLADRGLQVIQGINEDDSSASSNGSGKSSIGDAISWCLYGVTAREVKGDAVVNLDAKKDCRVSIVVSNGDTHYRVIRHRKHGTFKNALIVEVMAGEPSDGPTDLSRGTDTETQKVLEKIIGCSYEVFMAAVYSGQEVMPDLPKMKDRELKTLIEEAAGLQRIERAYALSRERLNIHKSKLEGLQRQLESAQEAKTRAEMVLADVIAKHDTWREGSATRIEAAKIIHIAAIKDESDAAKLVSELAPKKTAAKDRSVRNGTALADHKTHEAAAVTAERTLRSLEMAIDAGALKRLAAAAKTVEDQIANAAEEIKKPCTECGTVLVTMSVEDYIAHKSGHLTVATDKLTAAKVTARAQMAEVLRMRAEVVRLRALVPDVSALTIENVEDKSMLDHCESAQRRLTLCSMNMTAAHSTVILRETEPNPHESALEISRTNLADAVGRVGSHSEAMTTVAKEVAVAAEVAKVFGPAGVRAQILDSVTPFLNSRTADYLSTLSDGEITAVWTTLTKGASGDLKEKFSIDVTHAKGGDSFIALSGGEKRKVRLATALGLQDLVASRATQPLDLLMLDEVDDALDPAGLERLMTLLERKARERGTVLVISHSDLKDWADQITTVRKEKQWCSIVEGSLCE